MSQQNIDFGAFPDDPSADPIRSAFQKVQNNFNQLFSASTVTGAVTSVNKTPGAGVTVNQSTGNVVISANIACLQVRTSTLSMGRGANGNTSATITQSAQELVIDLPSTIQNVTNIELTGNANIAKNVSANNASITNNLNALGYANVGNLNSNEGVFTGNISAANASLGNLVVANYVSGTLITPIQPNITSVGILDSLTVIGNVTATNFIGNFSGNISGNITASGANTQVLFNDDGSVNASSGFTFDKLTGNVVISGGVRAGNGSGGNITGANLISANYFVGAGNGLSNIQAANINGVVANANYATTAGTATTATNATTAGTVTTNAQPNITSVGTLTGLTSNGTVNLSNASNVTLGSISNLHISGGSANYVLKTDGAGNLSWGEGGSSANIANGTSNVAISSSGGNITAGVNGTPNVVVISSSSLTVAGNVNAQYFNGNFAGNISGNLVIPGSNTGVVFNDAGNANSSAAFTFDKTSNTVTIAGNVTTGAGAGGNITGADRISANFFIGAGNSLSNIQGANVTGVVANANYANTAGNVGTLATLNVTGNTTSGNVKANSIMTIGNIPIYSQGSNGLSFNENFNAGGNLQTAYHFTTGANRTSAIFTMAVSGNFTVGYGTQGSSTNSQFVTWSEFGNTSFEWRKNVGLVPANLSSGTLLASISNTGNMYVSGSFAASGITSNNDINFTNASNVSLGSVANLKITGGSANYVLKTDGAGNLSWVAQGGGTGNGIANGTSNIQITTANGNITAGVGGNANVMTVTSNAVVIEGELQTGTGTGGNISGADYIIANYFTGTLTTNAQPNITSIGTLTGLTSNGTINFTNSSNVSLGNVANIKISGGSANYVLKTDGAGNLSWVAQGGGTGTGISNGTSNIQIATANGNITAGVSGNANVLVITGTGLNVSGSVQTGTGSGGNISGANNITANFFIGAGNGLSNIQGANVSGAVANANYATTTGTVTTAAQPNITSVGTLTSLGVNGNITAVNVTANTGIFTGNAAGLTNIPAANINGTVSSASTAVTVTASAQPNITSVGTLSNLSVSGNVSVAGNIQTGTGTGGDIVGVNAITANTFISSKYMLRSVGTGISANGSAQGDATSLSKEINVVSTVSTGQGVVLPTAQAGMVLYITNISANSLNVYPASGGAINNLSANAAFTQSAGSTITFVAPTSTQWYTVSSTYA